MRMIWYEVTKSVMVVNYGAGMTLLLGNGAPSVCRWQHWSRI